MALKTKTIQWIITIYAILMTGLAIHFIMKNNKMNKDKNFNYKWSLDNSELRFYHTETKNLREIWKDSNFDYNYEEVISYSTSEEKVSSSKDKNEDGNFETSIYYDNSNNVVGVWYDQNENGRHEQMEITLEDDTILVLLDEDENGKYIIKD